jgi:hypothetical protein
MSRFKLGQSQAQDEVCHGGQSSINLILRSIAQRCVSKDRRSIKRIGGLNKVVVTALAAS